MSGTYIDLTHITFVMLYIRPCEC